MTNHLSILVVCVAFSATACFAQKGPPVYFSANGRVMDNPDSANFYRVIDSRDGDSFRFTEYHKDSTWAKALAKGDIKRPVYLGETFYYKNGTVAIKKEYEKGRLLKTSGFYPNGVLMYVLFPRVSSLVPLLGYDADSLGRVRIANGNGSRQETDSIKALNIREKYSMTGPYKNGLKDGLWKGTDNRGFEFEETYETGKLISGTTKTPGGKKYRYTKFYEYPQFNGGIDKFEGHIVPGLKNVADTAGLRFFKHGYFQLSYTIDEDGKVVSIRGFKKQGRTPVELELKSNLPRNEPARLRGVPISYQITNNADVFVRHNFAPVIFQTDLYLKGTYRQTPQ